MIIGLLFLGIPIILWKLCLSNILGNIALDSDVHSKALSDLTFSRVFPTGTFLLQITKLTFLNAFE